MSDSTQGGVPDPEHPPASPKNSFNPDDLDAAWAEVEQELARPMKGTPSDSTMPTSPLPSDRVSSTVRSFDSSSPLIMVETAFLASAASLIWLVNFYFPVPVLRIFFPIPISLIYLRWGYRAAWMGALVSGLLLSVLMGPPRSLLYLMPFGFMGVLLGMLWRRQANWAGSIAIASILGSFGFFFRVWLVSLLLGDDLWLYTTTQVTNFIDWFCVRFGILFQPSLTLIQALVAGGVVINNLVYLFVVHLVAWFLFDRLRNPIPRPPKWVQVLMEYEE